MTDAASDKSRGVALGLVCLIGVLGAHRFYVGKIGTGFLMFLTGGGAGIWWIIDMINVATGAFRDRDGQRLLEWGVESSPQERLAAPDVDDELQAINEDLDDVTDRLERSERRLAELPPDRN